MAYPFATLAAISASSAFYNMEHGMGASCPEGEEETILSFTQDTIFSLDLEGHQQDLLNFKDQPTP